MPLRSDTSRPPASAPSTLSPRGWAVVIAMYALGLVLSGLLSPYHVWTRPISVCLTALNTLLSWALLWLGLSALRVERTRKLAGTLCTPLAWNTLMVSQFSLVGFLLIPLEVLAAGLFLRKRVQLSWLAALLLAAGTRLLSMGLSYAAKPAVVSFFPWGG